MNVPKQASPVAALILVSAVVLAAACEQPTSVPLRAELVGAAAAAAHGSYHLTGDCSESAVTIIDPGTRTMVAETLIVRGALIECPLTGDIEGTARVMLNLTVTNPGTPQAAGRVFGKSVLLVSRFFDRTDLVGTFEGPFNGSLADVRFGAGARINRHGTGAFQGLGLHGVAVQNPPGSGTEVEDGRIVGGGMP